MKIVRFAVRHHELAPDRRAAWGCSLSNGDADIDETLRRGLKYDSWFWSDGRRIQHEPQVALVDVEMGALGPAPEGDPAELRLCERHQRASR